MTMRAAVIRQDGKLPELMEFAEPQAAAGCSLIRVTAGGVGSSDVQRAAGVFGPSTGDYVVGGEGVGLLASGERVYFGHAVPPHGSWAERTIVPDAETWAIPDGVSDALAIAVGISGTGALIPLEEARIQKGENVLILGATGPVGQIGLQMAKLLGAGRVVAAARDAAALATLKQRGIADEIVQIGTGDDLAALREVAGDGFNVVLDIVYGAPAEAAMRATAPGARMMSIGIQAGPTVTLSLRDLVFRSHIGVGTGQRPAAERKAAFDRLIAHAARGEIMVDSLSFPLEQAAEAWAAQSGRPHAKIYVVPNAG